MIKIGKNTKFKILNPKVFENATNDDCRILDKYSYWCNTAIGGMLCHNKCFGKGFYGSWATISSKVHLSKGYVTVSCTTYEDMTWLLFDENTVDDDPDDQSCIDYTIKYIKDLREAGIIGKQLSV